MPATPAVAGDTRVRRKVLAMTVALAAITYLDRVAIGVTRPYIARDLNLTPTQMGYVFSAFYLSYALFEIPTGWWGDKVGTRKVLTRIVCWWSAFTVLTGFAWNYSSLLLIRFLFGAGEAGAWPNVARTFSRWFPRRDRGTVQGTFFMGAHLAGGLTPALATALLVYMDWRTLFVVFGSIGFVWALAWYRWFRDTPAEHPAVSAAERTFIEDGIVKDERPLEKTQWKRLLANRTVVCLCLMYFTQTFGNAFYVTWLPTYLASTRPVGRHGRHPLGIAAHAERGRGSDWRHHDRSWRRRRLGLRLGRILVGGGALTAAGLFTIAAAFTDSPDRRRGADRAGRRFVELSAWSGVGHVPRHRRPPGRRVERGDEHVGTGRRDPQPDSHCARRAAIWYSGRPALSDGCAVSAGCRRWLWVDPTKPVSD